jgi:cohesin loading factor subunit SCC2
LSHPDAVPPPLAFPSSPAEIFSSEEQKISAHGMLERLDAQANNTERASEQLTKTLESVQHLLNPSNLTQFRFNRPARFAQNNSRPAQATSTPSRNQLGSFAKMVLENTIPSHYATKKPNISTPVTTVPSKAQVRDISAVPTSVLPQQEQPRPRAETSLPPAQPSSSITKSHPQILIPISSSSTTATHPSKNHTTAPTPSQGSLPGSQRSIVAVVIPQTLTDAQRAQYVHVPDSKTVFRQDVPQEHKPPQHGTTLEVDQRLTSASIAQQEKANTAVTKLQNLIADILEAEDQLQSDTSGVVSSNATQFFNVEDMTEEAPILKANIQIQLDVTLQKVVSNARLSSIVVDDLGRIQRLCDHAVSIAGTTNYRIDDDTPQELDEWLHRIAVGEQGLHACKTLLRIMTAGREEKQLYSEESLVSLLNTLIHIVETCVVPVVEMRSSGDMVDAFKLASSQTKPLNQILAACIRVIKLLGDLVAKTDVDERAIISAEFICKTLVFVENATAEKDSALGIQKFETARRVAMDVLARIFARYHEQRQSIFDEILTLLEKLPVSRQSARQFKMVDAKPIQLVSALLMRLVQTSATRMKVRSKAVAAGEDLPDAEGGDEGQDQDSTDDEDDDADADSDFDNAIEKKQRKKLKPKKKSNEGPDDLSSLVNPLWDAAYSHAHYVVNYMVQRALTSTKSGDQPYRNLLDIFTEDFLSVLGNTDWPAAEMFLRALLAKLFELSENHKGSAPSKAMALELMGAMASRITELRLQSQSAARHPNNDRSEVTARLIQIHENIVTDQVEDCDELLTFDGPYRIVLEYLQARGVEDPALLTARGYHTVQWAKKVLQLSPDAPNSTKLQGRLAFMIKDPSWLETEYDFKQVTTEDSRFAAVLITLSLPFCRAFNKIFSKLLATMAGEQASLRSKSLKSIEQLLEMDPTILDQGTFFINSIIRCLQDNSTQVRDSALGLIAKCLSLRPKLDAMLYDRVISRAQDANLHVRKRAMKMLKDMYLRNDSLNMKALIADTLIHRVTDMDESIVELARHTFEEIWMIPFHTISGSDTDAVKKKLRLREQTSLVINIVKRKTESTEAVLPELLQQILSDKSKAAKPNIVVCKEMVKLMFDAIIDPNELPESPPQQHVLQTLTIFAAANAKLFTADQLRTLQPYVKNLSSDDNLLVYRSAIVILRHTLPHMKNLDKDFLFNLQQALLGSFTRLPPAELKEVAICLWTLDGELHNTEKLVRVTISLFDQIKKSLAVDMNNNPAAAQKTKRLINIAGYFGKAFNLDAHLGTVKARFPDYKGDHVAYMAVDLICPFTSPKQPMILRQAALDSVCMLCQAWPGQLMRTDVCNAFELAFRSDDAQLPLILIVGLKDFFCAGDKPGESNSDNQVGTDVDAGNDRLGKTYMATDRDGAATSIAQQFLQDIRTVALTSTDAALALNAVQVVASINRQGLVHPKETGPCFIALETCPDAKISNMAFQEHLGLYAKHEAMFEKEHIGAIHQAFEYQQTVVKSNHGYNGSPPVSKMHHFWEVLKTGKAKTRIKFLTAICGKTGVGFDVSKIDMSGDLPLHVAFTRFCCENLAFFDYTKFEELQHLIDCVEKVMANTGTPVAHMVDVDILRMRIEQDVPAVDAENEIMNGTASAQSNSIDPTRLRELAVYAQILLILWELRTYLRRLWNVSKHQAVAKGKANKDGARAPQRIPNATGLTDKYLGRNQEIMSALETPEGQLGICTSFSEVMAIDSELKVEKEDVDGDMDTLMTLDGDDYETPSERDDSVAPGSGQKRGRKRKSIGSSQNTTPRKKGKARKSSSVQGRSVSFA